MPTPINALLLDLDGTLLNTADDLVAALHTVQKTENVPLTDYPHARPQVPNGSLALVTVGFPQLNPNNPIHADSLEQHRLALIDAYAAQPFSDTPMLTHCFEGLEAALQTWEASQRPWGIVTNKPRALTEPLLKHFGFDQRISVLVCGDDLPTRKPKPDTLLHAAKQLNIAPEHCIYLGDDERDVTAAHAANMRILVAAYDYLPEGENPNNWQADGVLQHASDLTPALKTLESAHTDA